MKKTNENGITLIALVVTIVVLLILAGITITYVMADGGIFSSAKQSAEQTIKSQVLDYASQIQATYMTQYTVKSATGVEPAEGTINLVGTTGLTGADLTKFFPTSAGFSTVTGTLKDEKGAAEAEGPDGNVEGDVTVTYSGKTIKVTFTNGVPTIAEYNDAAGE